MCLLLIANRSHPKYKLIIAANRDEFYERPTAPAGFWEDCPDLLAGKDLRAGGTWLGITKTGRIAAVTNYRSGLLQNPDARSRGELTKDFLVSDISPESYAALIRKKATEYNRYNLVFGTTDELYYYSNLTDAPERMNEGIYGLSNCLLNTPWPKVTSSKINLQSILNKEPEDNSLLELLGNSEVYSDDLLPDTGIGVDLERYLSAVFIKTPVYGTRASTIIKVGYDNEVTFIEKTFNSTGEAGIKMFKLRIK